MRIALGPIAPNGTDDWPLVGCETLASEGFEVVPFGPDEAPPPAEVLIAWSIEYLDAATLATLRGFPGFRCAVVGDWHVHDPAPEALRGFNLVAADLRYVRSHPDVGAIWFRQFSHDPRLHTSDDTDWRPTDVAFYGRPQPARDGLVERVKQWCQRTGHTYALRTVPYQRGEEAAAYRAAKLVFNRAVRGELNMRAYESAACGALAVLQHDAPEVFAAHAPIPTYDPGDGNLEAFLEAWLADHAARAAMVARQREWVARETPSRHLRFLCRAIQQRLEEHPPARLRPSRTRHAAQPEAISPPVVGGAVPAAEPGHNGQKDEPPLNEQRRECAALVPAEARVILDAGCHEGGFGHFLKTQQPDRIVWGVDLSEPALAVAARRLDGVSRSVDLDGPWPAEPWNAPGSYDAICLLDILEHLVLPGRALRRLRPLLQPDGCVVASIPNLRNLGVIFDLVVKGRFPYHTPGRTPFEGPPSNIRCSGHLRFFCRSDIERLFTEAGYVIEEWAETPMRAPGLERFKADTAFLVAVHGGDAEAWKSECMAMQFLCRARPDWNVAVEGD